MILSFIGTRAQLIKMVPVVKAIEETGSKQLIFMTGQHQETMEAILQDFSLAANLEYLYEGKEITGIGQTLFWIAGLVKKIFQTRARIRAMLKSNENNVLLVHGDTLSTLVGVIAGKVWGVPIAHVEAGLRSFRLFDPFPEELIRRIVTQMSEIAFCPGEWACKNLGGTKNLEIVNTSENTLVDSLRDVLARSQNEINPSEAYVIVSSHRFENIFSETRLGKIVDIVEAISERVKVIFVLHPATRKQLKKRNLYERIEANSNITLMPRMSYSKFVNLLSRACCVLTDGGGNQEEMSYLGKPALLLRAVTERKEGIGTTVVVTNLDKALILEEIEKALRYAPTQINIKNGNRPSAIIAEHLIKYG